MMRNISNGFHWQNIDIHQYSASKTNEKAIARSEERRVGKECRL